MEGLPAKKNVVAFVVPRLKEGGAEHIMQLVARQLAHTHPEAKILLVSLLDVTCPANMAKTGPEIICLGRRRVLQSLPALGRCLWQQRVNVVVSTLPHVIRMVALLRMVWPRPLRHVARLANTYSCQLADTQGRLIEPRWLTRWVCRGVDAFVAVSQGVKEDFSVTYGVEAARITVIPNPIDPIHTTGELAAGGRAEGIYRIVMVGRLVAQKNVAMALQAVAELKGIVKKPVNLYLVGSGPLENDLRVMAKSLGLEDNVAFMGRCENVADFYHKADVFLLTSNYEGFPNVVLEALAHGVPVVSVNCPSGPADILSDDRLGTLVPAVPMQVAKALASRLQRKESVEMRHFRRNHVATTYALSGIAQAYGTVMKGIKQVQRILVVGNFGYKTGQLDGQTVKTRTLYASLKQEPDTEVRLMDVSLHGLWACLLLPWRLVWAQQVVFLPGMKQLMVLGGIMALLKPFFGFKVHYVVVGGWLPNRARMFYIRWLLERFDSLSCELESMRQKLLPFNPRTVVLTNYRPETEGVQQPSPAVGGRLRLVYFSRLMREKGLFEAMEVAERLAATGAAVTLDIWGQLCFTHHGDEALFRQRVVQNPTVLRYGGALNPAEVQNVLSRYDVMLFLTRYQGEGFPGCLVDAMQAGLAVVCSNWKYNAEIVAESGCGLLVDGDLVAEAVQKLQGLPNDSNVLNDLKLSAYKGGRKYGRAAFKAWYCTQFKSALGEKKYQGIPMAQAPQNYKVSRSKTVAIPSVSIIMPMYNAEEFIAEAIASVQAQTYADWELIVVDDFSSDKGPAIVTKLAEEDERIRLVNMQVNQGPTAARNHALDLARGRYVAFLDGDDIWLPEKLEKQVQLLATTPHALCCTSYGLIHHNGSRLPQVRKVKAKAYKLTDILHNNVIGCLTSVVDTHKTGPLHVNPTQWNERARGDYVLWLNVLEEGRTAWGIPEVLAMYRLSRKSVSSKKIRAAGGMWRVLRYNRKFPFWRAMIYFTEYALRHAPRVFERL